MGPLTVLGSEEKGHDYCSKDEWIQKQVRDMPTINADVPRRRIKVECETMHIKHQLTVYTSIFYI